MVLKHLSSLTASEYKEFVDSFDTVLTDCDGVLWIGNKVIKGAPDVIYKLKQLGKKVFYVTNNSTRTRDDFVEKFKLLGFDTCKEEIVSTAYLTACYLKSIHFNKIVYLVGPPSIAKELDNVGIKHTGLGPDPLKTNIFTYVNNVNIESDVGAVVIAFDEHISLPKMIKAVTYIEKRESLFIVTNIDEQIPINANVILPDAGSVVAAIRACVKRPPVVIGKPESFIGEYLVNEHKINPSRTIMIGDRCDTDILFGKSCGFQTLLVLSGLTKIDEVNGWKAWPDEEEKALVPNFFTEKICDLLPHL